MANAQRTFASGELAPALWARTDVAKYASGLKTCRNHLVLQTGGAMYRPGTEYVADAGVASLPVRLVPFVFNNADALMMEFGPGYIRFHQNGAPVVDSFGVVVEIGTPYTAADLALLRFAQSADVVVIVHRNYAPMELSRTSDTSWALTAVPFGPSLPALTIGSASPGAVGTFQYDYAVTAISPADGTESPISGNAECLGASPPTASLPNTIDWTRVTAPGVPQPNAPTVGQGGTPGIKAVNYAVVARFADGSTSDPSLLGSTATSNATLSAGNFNTLTWAAVTGAVTYDLYRFAVSGQLTSPTTNGKIGTTGLTTFNDTGLAGDENNPPTYIQQYRVYLALAGTGIYGLVGTQRQTLPMGSGFVVFNDTTGIPDFTQQPTVPFAGFQGPDDYPGVVGFYQQRQLFAGTTNQPDTVWCSRTGSYRDFTTHTILEDDDAVIFTLANAEVTEIRSLLDIGKLVIGAEGGEWLVEGDSAGVLTPTSVNMRVGSYNGCAPLPPIKVDNSILYVQGLGTKILELKTQILYGYFTFTGVDHTLYASHLFNGFSIVDWAYQQVPNYVTWAIRSDGALLGFTYVPAENLAAWHRHDTAGTFTAVGVIPEGGEHRVYVAVQRTVQGQTRQFIERLRSLTIIDPVAESGFMDSALEYDGRNAGAVTGATMTLTGGSTWMPDEVLTLTCSQNEFSAANIGDARFLYDATGAVIRCLIEAVTSATQALVTPDTNVPATLQGFAAVSWDRAVSNVAGLSHLEGLAVSCFADGYVVSSPNNPQCGTITVTAGVAALGSPYAHIRVGLPYAGDLETLDIDSAAGESLKRTKINVTGLGLFCQASRGIFAGPAFPADDGTDGLREVKVRRNDQLASPVAPVTGYVDLDVPSGWTPGGSVCIRQVDPVPLTVLALMPMGFIPPTGGG